MWCSIYVHPKLCQSEDIEQKIELFSVASNYNRCPLKPIDLTLPQIIVCPSAGNSVLVWRTTSYQIRFDQVYHTGHTKKTRNLYPGK